MDTALALKESSNKMLRVVPCWRKYGMSAVSKEDVAERFRNNAEKWRSQRMGNIARGSQYFDGSCAMQEYLLLSRGVLRVKRREEKRREEKPWQQRISGEVIYLRRK